MEAPHGRRVLVAVIPGDVGERIQAWRREHDPKHAARLPPHLTVCYRPPDAPLELLEAQVRHAFPSRISVHLGGVFVLAHREEPFAVQVLETTALNAARRRLFDGRFVQMGGRDEWPWHITCVRYGHLQDRETLLAAAARDLALDATWSISQVSYLELRNGRYQPIAEWELTPGRHPGCGI